MTRRDDLVKTVRRLNRVLRFLRRLPHESLSLEAEHELDKAEESLERANQQAIISLGMDVLSSLGGEK